MIDLDFTDTNRVLLRFGKTYHLSIINDGYGAPVLYEIGVFKGDKMVELPGITEEGDAVKGWLNEEKVRCIILKMFCITGCRPEIEEDDDWKDHFKKE